MWGGRGREWRRETENKRYRRERQPKEWWERAREQRDKGEILLPRQRARDRLRHTEMERESEKGDGLPRDTQK